MRKSRGRHTLGRPRVKSARCNGPTDPSFLETQEIIQRLRKQTAINLKIKLGLLFGFLTVLLIVSSSMSYLLVKQIDNEVQNLGRVEEPLMEAVFTMEISIGKGTEAVIQYSIDRDKQHIQSFKETNFAFADALEEYNLLAGTFEEMDAGLRIGQINSELGELSDNVVGVTDSIGSDLNKLGDGITSIHDALVYQLEENIDPNTLEGLEKIEAVLTLAIDVDEAFLGIQSYAANPAPRIRQDLRKKRAGLRFSAVLTDGDEVEALFKPSQLSPSQLTMEVDDLVGVLDDLFFGVVIAGESIMDQVDEQGSIVMQLEDRFENMGRIMDEEIQPVIFAATARRLIDAESSVDTAKFAAFILAALAAVVIAGAALVVARQIVNPIVRLTEAAVELGKGNLAIRTDVESRDEIGTLAASFNQMAAARQQGESNLSAAQDEIVRTEKLAVIGQWSGGIAHDLRNPIGAIKNASYLLKKGLSSSGVVDADNKLNKYVDLIDQQVVKSNKIISDLMTFVKVGAFALTETNLKQVLTETLETMQKNDNVELSQFSNPDLSPVMADGDQLQRVFLNLANNAQEAMPKGGKLTITAKNVNSHVEIDFADTGEGISEENIGKIFDPLFTRKAQGTGLGLAVCQEIILRHGGTICARPNEEPSGGTVFEVRLPAAAQKQRAEGEPANDF